MIEFILNNWQYIAPAIVLAFVLFGHRLPEMGLLGPLVGCIVLMSFVLTLAYWVPRAECVFFPSLKQCYQLTH